jgi:hypothetical protein
VARVQIPIASVNHFALTPTPAARACDVTNGNYVVNDGATMLHFNNASGAPQTVTFTLPSGADVNLTIGPRLTTILTGQTGDTGFWPVDKYGTSLLFTGSSASITVYAESFA